LSNGKSKKMVWGNEVVLDLLKAEEFAPNENSFIKPTHKNLVAR